MSDDPVEAALDEHVAEVLAIRYGVDLPEVGTDPRTVLQSLQHTRRSLDRVEELLSRTVRIRARAQRMATHAGNVFDDAWDTAAQQRRTNPVVHGGEYSSARERTAEANLATLDLRVGARSTAELAHRCDEAVEVIRLAHRGLESVRQDHLAVLRALQFESSLDR